MQCPNSAEKNCFFVSRQKLLIELFQMIRNTRSVSFKTDKNQFLYKFGLETGLKTASKQSFTRSKIAYFCLPKKAARNTRFWLERAKRVTRSTFYILVRFFVEIWAQNWPQNSLKSVFYMSKNCLFLSHEKSSAL
jgi:hypothetical protein